jgi:hypothetical protein
MHRHGRRRQALLMTDPAQRAPLWCFLVAMLEMLYRTRFSNLTVLDSDWLV